MVDFSAALFFSLYTFLQMYLFVTAMRIPAHKNKHNGEKNSVSGVSVVIPVKNEARNLPTLLTSLENQKFFLPLEIIFIDDGSTDGSGKILADAASVSGRNIRTLQGTFDPDCHLTGKQQALDLGVRLASHELIALTDADMVLNPDWIDTLYHSMSAGTALVFGHTTIHPQNHPFSFLQSLQLEFLFSIASLFHHSGIAGSCMGNNLMIRKSIYLQYGGQKKIGYTVTEDRALLCFFHKNRQPTEIVTPFHPTASTFPHVSMSDYFQQIGRWAAGGFSTGANLFFFGLVFLAHVFLTIIAAAGVFTRLTGTAAIVSFISAWLVIILAFNKNRSPVSPFYFPLLYFFMASEAVLLPLYMLFNRKLIWKGKSI